MRLANDGKCFVLSEAIDGAAAPPADFDRARPDVVFGATLGTGVGGGIVVDGRVLTGEYGAATEWSHTTLPFLRPGEHAPYVCFCGHGDCIESFTSGRALAAWHHALGGGDVDGNEIGRRAAAGDAAADQRSWPTRRRSRARWPWWSTCSIRAPSCSAAGYPNNERIFRNVPPAVGAMDGPGGSPHQAGARRPRRRERRARRRDALAAAGVSAAPAIIGQPQGQQ